MGMDFFSEVLLKLRNIKIGKNEILLTISTFVFIVLLVEGGMWLFDSLNLFPRFFQRIGVTASKWDRKTGDGLYFTHPYTSYAMKPGYNRQKRRKRSDRINSLGYRGKEFARDKPEGVYRIVALGGSTTYGIWQPDTQTYPVYLQKIIQSKTNQRIIEVINAGLVGATSAESYHRMPYDVLPLKPDMLVIYHGINDVGPRMFNNFSNDYYHFRRIPINRNSTFMQFYTYRLIVATLFPRMFTKHSDLIPFTWRFENVPNTNEEKIQNFEKTTTRAFEQHLDSIITLAQGKGIRVVMATFAINDELSHWNDWLPAELWGRGVQENNKAVRRLAERYQLPLVEFHDFAADKPELFHDSIHMKAEANYDKASLFADTIFPIILEDLENERR